MFPELTEDRRKELVKVVRNRAEEGRVAVRNARRHARHELEALEKDGEISKDDLDRAEKDLEKRTHEVVAEIDELLKHKETGAALHMTVTELSRIHGHHASSGCDPAAGAESSSRYDARAGRARCPGGADVGRAAGLAWWSETSGGSRARLR